MPKEIDVEKIFSNKKLSEEEQKFAQIFEQIKQNKPEKKSLNEEQKETLKNSLLGKYDFYHPKKSRFFNMRLVFNVGVMMCLLVITYMINFINNDINYYTEPSTNIEYNNAPIIEYPKVESGMNFYPSPVSGGIKGTNSAADVSIVDLVANIWMFFSLLLLINIGNNIYSLYQAKDNLGIKNKAKKSIKRSILWLVIIWFLYSIITWLFTIMPCAC